ncbi:lateral organ boundaries domain-containing protein, partial [Cynara cardunculus var. scolymus]
RRCAKDCIFAPYFPSDDPHKFAIVHKVFGASNVSKMLQELPFHQRADAVSSLVYEANARMRDPVYGCVGAISYLQNQVSQLQIQLAMAQAEILCTIQQQQQQQPPSAINGRLPELHPAQSTTILMDDVVSNDMISSYLHNTITNHHHQHFNLTSNSVIQYDSLKRESSSLWT